MGLHISLGPLNLLPKYWEISFCKCVTFRKFKFSKYPYSQNWWKEMQETNFSCKFNLFLMISYDIQQFLTKFWPKFEGKKKALLILLLTRDLFTFSNDFVQLSWFFVTSWPQNCIKSHPIGWQNDDCNVIIRLINILLVTKIIEVILKSFTYCNIDDNSMTTWWF